MAKNKRTSKVAITKGSGNVFADLGLPDAEELETKAKLVIQITKIIEQKKLTQVTAAACLGIDQPRISDLMNGKLRGFSVYRLMHFVSLLGHEVKIVTKDLSKPADIEAISVS